MLRPGTMMVSRAGERLAHRHCGCCGDELNAHQAVSSGVCDKPRCQDWKIEQAGAALLQRRRQELKDRLFREASSEVAAAAAGIGGDPESAVRATLPWQGKPLAPQLPERRTAFEEHLRRIVDKAFAGPVPEGDEPGRAGIEADEAPVLATACAICSGRCCDRGGTTGMLEAAEIARWRRRAPQATPDEAIAAYTALLPAESVAGSCVYLGAAGCGLPRPMRANWCNRFQCRERAGLQSDLAEAGDDRALMIANDSDNNRPGGIGGWSAAAGLVHVPLAPASGEEDAGPDGAG
ncbi:MAG TPA: hypothetical protein VFJ13_02140 [Paracoccaceae bacterium]|nr:hypothetical protein [Paracoccaceae bacterium]